MSPTDAAPPPAIPHDAHEGDAPVPGETYVVFSVDTHGYALPVDTVHHVLPLPRVTRVPTDAGHILGVFHHGGKVLPLWDLHTLFGAEGPPPERPSVLVFAYRDRRVGLLVERVDEVVTVEDTEIVPTEEEVLAPHVTGLLAGWLRVPDETEAAEDEDDPTGLTGPEQLTARLRAVAEDRDTPAQSGLETMLAATGRPDRGVAILALLAPVHLIQPDRLYSLGTGDGRHMEGRHGRP